MSDDPKAVLARLPPLVVKHSTKMKEIRTQWKQGCAQILQSAKLPEQQQIEVVMKWLEKAGVSVRDYVLGKMVLGFARPQSAAATEEQKKERREKRLVRQIYNDDIPHLRAVNKVLTDRLEGVPRDIAGSLALVDSRDDREKASPGTMFAEFAESIEKQAAIEYKPACNGDGSPFANVDAA